MEQNNLMNMLNFVADQTMALTKENSVLGEPVEKDGVTVIPVSKLTVGFAGGGADVVDAGKKKRRHPAGGGAQVSMTPMSFVVISGGEAQVLNISAPANASKNDIINTVVDAVKDFMNKKKEQQAD
ncbi:MAG: GerW family sporulation protein [Clostridia bacterium]|nr:GerW family sporulation protein [Clostridia bacterium]